MSVSPQVEKLLSYIHKSPTAFHAIAAAEEDLLPGFTRLQEGEKWALQPGGRYFVTRNRSSLIAFTLPEGPAAGFQLVAAHSDSPGFKVKENAELRVRDKYLQLDVERYGGMIFSSWLDRPLSVAGRAVVRTAHGLSTRLVNLDRDLCVIPNVAIHMNRQVNDGYKYQPQIDLNPLWGTADAAGSLRRLVAEAAQAEEKDLLGSDLFLYNRVPGRVWGVEEAFLSSGRLDDLECAFAALTAIAGSPADGHVNVCCVFDNEEVGSTTRQGANSTFLNDTLRRIALALGQDEAGYLAMLACSYMLSADNAHAVHPNHPEYSDPVNVAYMNQGVVLKYNANQRYTTDGLSAAVFHRLCEGANVPVQHYANHSDLPGGGTLGNISGSQVSIPTADIGLAQLAMHSAWETAGTKDLDWMIAAMQALYTHTLLMPSDGEMLFQP